MNGDLDRTNNAVDDIKEKDINAIKDIIESCDRSLSACKENNKLKESIIKEQEDYIKFQREEIKDLREESSEAFYESKEFWFAIGLGLGGYLATQ